MTRRYAVASGTASAGTRIATMRCGVAAKPTTAKVSDTSAKNASPVPTVRLASATSFAPKACATSTVDARLKPKVAPSSKNKMLLAFAVAASARSPSRCTIHAALTEALSDWSTLLASVGSAKAASVRPTGPSVRLTEGFMRTGSRCPPRAPRCAQRCWRKNSARRAS
jgi:hypothetical protein